MAESERPSVDTSSLTDFERDTLFEEGVLRIAQKHTLPVSEARQIAFDIIKKLQKAGDITLRSTKNQIAQLFFQAIDSFTPEEEQLSDPNNELQERKWQKQILRRIQTRMQVNQDEAERLFDDIVDRLKPTLTPKDPLRRNTAWFHSEVSRILKTYMNKHQKF